MARERDIHKLIAPPGDNTNFPVGESASHPLAALIVIHETHFIAYLNHLVLMDNLFLAKTLAVPATRLAKLVPAKTSLQPAIEIIDPMRVHARRRKYLEAFDPTRRIELNSTVFPDSESTVESDNVAGMLQPQIGLELLEQALVEVIGRLPEADIQIVE